MCDTIFNADTNELIDTQPQLEALVGPGIWQYYEDKPPEPGMCLCDIDHESMLRKAGYVVEYPDGNTTEPIISRRLVE